MMSIAYLYPQINRYRYGIGARHERERAIPVGSTRLKAIHSKAYGPYASKPLIASMRSI